MKSVFGLPAAGLANALGALFVVTVVIVAVVATRNPVFLKIGVRNIPRRPGRTALIVAGLMLATTIFASALLTGDTMARTVRAEVFESLGATDIVVVGGTAADVADVQGLEAPKPYFDVAAAVSAIDAAAAELPVDAVAPAIVEQVAVQHQKGGRTEPRITLAALAPDRAEAFGLEEISTLGLDEAMVDEEAARELNARPGSRLTVLIGSTLAELTVTGVGSYPGTTTSEGAIIVGLDTAQRLLGQAGAANHVFISNDGDDSAGVAHTDMVEAALDEAVAPLGLDAQPSKRDGLDLADQTGNVFVSLFTTFGSFSMAAGVLLIFLIFVMLAAERRPEMGIARAVGTQRRHLVQSFLYEGAVYDLIAAAVGVVLGIGVSYLMVRLVGNAFAGRDLDLRYSLSGRSLAIASSLGVLLTFGVVTVSAWRVSRLNIVSAIRDIPELEDTRPKRRWLGVTMGLLFGTVLAVSGAASKTYLPWMLGISLIVIAVVPLVTLTGRTTRFAYTSCGLLLIVLWLLPLSAFDALLGEMSKDFSIWIASGLIIVVAATWVITYNADVLLRAIAKVASPFASLRPVMRMAAAYPLKSRFRTGITMAMFMLVVFTLVTGSTIPAAFVKSFMQVDSFGGGFDIRVSSAPAAATADLRGELPDVVADDIVASAGQSFVPVDAKQAGTDGPFERYPVRGVDDAFLEHTTYELVAMAEGYDSPREVFDAMAATPGLAVVDPFVAPRRDQWGFAVPPAFQLSGFYLEDGTFEPITVSVHDPLTDVATEVTVIGVFSDATPFTMAGITVSQATLAPFGDRALPTVHHLVVREGADKDQVAGAVESALLSLGVEAETYERLADDALGAQMLIINLVQGFMALGLVVGVAALGVVSARAVVERRAQIGILRAIGFPASMIRRTLLAETAIVAIGAITAGTVLGLIVSYNVVDDAKSQMGNTALTFGVPWLYLSVILGSILLAAIATSLLSAHRASRIYPAEALRYH
jgi:putative ABC transport system permease protein